MVSYKRSVGSETQRAQGKFPSSINIPQINAEGPCPPGPGGMEARGGGTGTITCWDLTFFFFPCSNIRLAQIAWRKILTPGPDLLVCQPLLSSLRPLLPSPTAFPFSPENISSLLPVGSRQLPAPCQQLPMSALPWHCKGSWVGHGREPWAWEQRECMWVTASTEDVVTDVTSPRISAPLDRAFLYFLSCCYVGLFSHSA